MIITLHLKTLLFIAPENDEQNLSLLVPLERDQRFQFSHAKELTKFLSKKVVADTKRILNVAPAKYFKLEILGPKVVFPPSGVFASHLVSSLQMMKTELDYKLEKFFYDLKDYASSKENTYFDISVEFFKEEYDKRAYSILNYTFVFFVTDLF